MTVAKDSSAGIQLLNGVKVVELSSMVAGPSCGKLFADQGAEVVKVEPPQGDEARRRGPFAKDHPGLDRSLLFLYLNTNKLGVTLNIERPTGKRILLDLIKQADIFIVEQPPAYLEERRLDYQHLKALNPGLIVTTITPFGWTGPYRDYKAYYLNAYHAGGDGYMLPGGQLAASLYRDREPIKAGGYIGEYQVGISAATGTVSALLERLDAGTGDHVDVSKQEAMMHLNSSDIALYPNEGHVWHRYNRIPPYLGGMLQCKDGFWQTNIHQDHQWQGIVEFMGNPEWALEEEYATRKGRLDHRGEIEPKLQEWAMDHPKEEIYHELQARRAACGPVYTVEEVVKDAHEQARSFFQEVTVPEIGQITIPAAPWKLSDMDWSLRRSPPRLGEHNADIFCDRLGFSKEELVKLRQTGIT